MRRRRKKRKVPAGTHVFVPEMRDCESAACGCYASSSGSLKRPLKRRILSPDGSTRRPPSA